MLKKLLFPIIGIIIGITIGITILFLIISGSLVFGFKDQIFPTTKEQAQNQTQPQPQPQAQNQVLSQNTKSNTNTNTETNPNPNSNQLETPPKESSLTNALKAPTTKPLVADATHDVVVLDDCDLAVRYEKKYIDLKYDQAQKILNFNAKTDDTDNFLMYVSCKKDKNPDFKEVKCDDQVFNLIFISQQKASKCYLNDTYATSDVDNFVTFGNKNLYFGLSYKLFTHGLYTNQDIHYDEKIEIQPNSPAPSTPSVKL